LLKNIMNYFFKILNKFKVYFFYLINKQSREFFFILINRKINTLINKINPSKENKFNILRWCNKKRITENNFYRQLGIHKPRDFFIDKKSYYYSAKLKESKLKYKMGGMAHLNLIYNLMLHFKPKTILETGVAFGWSTLVFYLSKKINSSVISVDLSYPTASSDKFVALALPSNIKKKINLLRGIDYNYLKSFNQNKKHFDFIHYDSDKSYEGRKKNYELIWNILKKKGCFISDDISDNRAFYDFIKLKKINFYIIKLSNKYVGIVFK